MTETQIFDADTITGTLKRLAAEISERCMKCTNVVMLGIQKRGVPLAQRITDYLYTENGLHIPVGALGVTFYRDDIGLRRRIKVPQKTEIPFDVSGKRIILVDDVLFTGRTIRAAMDEIMDNGRPQQIQLLVLIDRGGRELPIAADYTGKVISAAHDEKIIVNLKETDGIDTVISQRSI